MLRTTETLYEAVEEKRETRRQLQTQTLNKGKTLTDMEIRSSVMWWLNIGEIEVSYQLDERILISHSHNFCAGNPSATKVKYILQPTTGTLSSDV